MQQRGCFCYLFYGIIIVSSLTKQTKLLMVSKSNAKIAKQKALRFSFAC